MANWGNILSGAGAGALTGGQIGTTILPGIGTGIGAGLGALAGGLGGYGLGKTKNLLDTPEKTTNINRFSPEQQQFINQLLGVLGGSQQPTGLLGQLLNTEGFEKPAMRQFQEEIVPGLAERFSGAGAQKSSAFQQALGASAADLEERLASLRQGQLSSVFQSILGQALTPQFNQYFQPSGPSAFSQGLGALLSGAGQGIGQSLGRIDFTRGLGKESGVPEQQGSYIDPRTGQITGAYYG